MEKLYLSIFGHNRAFHRLFIILGILFILWIFIENVFSIAGNVGAIIISGSSEVAFSRDVSKMTSTLTNTSVGYGVPSSNIYFGNNVAFSDFQTAINQMNTNGVSDLHIYISSHGCKNGISFSGGPISKSDFISAINQSSATTKHIVLDSCYSGTFYNDLLSVVRPNGSAITATDENHKAKYLFSSFFTSTLSNYMENSNTDKNSDGKVSYYEALDRLKKEGGLLPNIGHPKSISIPTLSEWKQIFWTLIMLSLLMGFRHKTHSETTLSNWDTMLRITDSSFLAFNRHAYSIVLKWAGVVTVLGLTGAKVVTGNLQLLDIIGTLFCVPLVAYILHLLIPFIDVDKNIFRIMINGKDNIR